MAWQAVLAIFILGQLCAILEVWVVARLYRHVYQILSGRERTTGLGEVTGFRPPVGVIDV